MVTVNKIYRIKNARFENAERHCRRYYTAGLIFSCIIHSALDEEHLTRRFVLDTWRTITALVNNNRSNNTIFARVVRNALDYNKLIIRALRDLKPSCTILMRTLFRGVRLLPCTYVPKT